MVESFRCGDTAVASPLWDWDCEVLSSTDAGVDDSVDKEVNTDGVVDWKGDFDVD